MSGWAAAAQVAGNIFDSWYNNDEAMRRQSAANQYGWQTLGAEQQWAEKMRSTAFQTQTDDLQKAGLNPMLGYMHASSGAPTPTGPSPSLGAIASPSGSTMGRDLASAFAVDQNAKVADATANKLNAEADATRASNPVNIENVKAQTDRAREEIRNLIQQQQTGAATAQNLKQQTINLQAQLPVMRETVQNLKALTALHGEQANLAFKQAGLTVEQGQKLQQDVAANIPRLEAALREIEIKSKTLGLPQQEARASVYGAAGGNQGALLEFLNALPIPFTFKTYNINK